MMKGIIVNADDLGMSEEIDKRIFLAAKQGRLHSASASVVNGVSSKTRLQIKTFFRPNSLGLHMNLTDGVPVAIHNAPRILINSNGHFRSAIELLKERSLSPDILYGEMIAQLERFVMLFGFKPAHIDSHQHFTYLHPKAFSAFLRLAQKENIKIRSPRPFLNANRLQRFVNSVEKRFNVTLPFCPNERALLLVKIFHNHEVTERTMDCILEFSEARAMKERTRNGTIEFICHP